MNVDKLKGIIPTIATPFTKDFNLDLNTLDQLVHKYIDVGVHGITVAGSQGEFFSLTAEEHLQVLETTIKAVNGRVPMYAGTGTVTTKESIRITQAAESMGADAALVITPYFAQPNQEELVEHFVEIAKSTKLPVILYNNPPRTKVNVLPSTLFECMRQAENIIGIKDSSGDLTQAIEYKLFAERPAVLYSGRDTISFSMMLHGADGAISPAANVFPELVIAMYDSLKAGEVDKALRISNILAPLRAAWALGSFPVVIKEAMTMTGWSAGPARPPIRELSSANRARLQKVVDEIKAEIPKVI